MEHEITDVNARSAKSTLTTIVKVNAASCAFFSLTWALAALLSSHANPLAGLSGVGLMLGLLLTIAALNARLRVELEEPDSAE
jgi:hypothetical protein